MRTAVGRIFVAVSTIFVVGLPASAQSEAAAVQGILRVIPPEAHAAFIVPNLKRASDDLTRLLEGMDRANLLLGLRPIDQFKSVTGFTVGLDDHGSAAVVVVDAGSASEGREPRVVTIVPAMNPQEFINMNLTEVEEGEPDARKGADGTVVYVRALSAHVIMGENMQTVRDYAERDGFEPVLNELAGGQAAIFNQGECGIIIRQPTIAAMKQSLERSMARVNAVAPGAVALASEIADDVEFIAISLDCDPLAVIARGVVRFRDEADFGKLASNEPSIGGNPGLSSIPDKRYALALSIDLSALGGEDFLRGVAQAMGKPPEAVPAWLAATREIVFAIAPSAAGTAGGLLNEATLVLLCEDAAAVRDGIRTDILALGKNPAIKREAKWTVDQSLRDVESEITADAWEVRTTSVPSELGHVEMMERFLFGTGGVRGYVREQPQAVLMTFSQRPSILESLMQSVRHASSPNATQGAGFGGSATIRFMRTWMPAQPDVEAYLNAEAVRQTVGTFASVLPEFSPGLPPVGAAIDVQPQRAEAAMIAPARVLAPLFDEFARRVKLQQQPAFEGSASE